MPEIVYDTVQEYLATLVPAREPELQAMEALAEQNDFPIIGPACAHSACATGVLWSGRNIPSCAPFRPLFSRNRR